MCIWQIFQSVLQGRQHFWLTVRLFCSAMKVPPSWTQKGKNFSSLIDFFFINVFLFHMGLGVQESIKGGSETRRVCSKVHILSFQCRPLLLGWQKDIFARSDSHRSVFLYLLYMHKWGFYEDVTGTHRFVNPKLKEVVPVDSSKFFSFLMRNKFCRFYQTATCSLLLNSTQLYTQWIDIVVYIKLETDMDSVEILVVIVCSQASQRIEEKRW